MIKACVVCGGEFSGRGKMCSTKCRIEKNREKTRRSYAKNRQKRLEYMHRYCTNNREKYLESQRRFREKDRAINPEKYRERGKQHYKKYREKRLEEERLRRGADPEKYREQRRQLRAKNIERYRNYGKKTYDQRAAALKLIREIETKGIGALS